MSVERDLAYFLGRVAAHGIKIAPPPTRAETIKEAWRLYGEHFDYADGKLILEHDIGVIEPPLFELKDYGDITAVEAEGVIVARMPRLRPRQPR